MFKGGNIMKKQIVFASALVLGTSVLVGCGPYYGQPGYLGAGVGTLAGGAIGYGVTGGSAIGTAVGAVGGGLLGYGVGTTYHRHHHYYYYR
jgi:hypothetical protein